MALKILRLERNLTSVFVNCVNYNVRFNIRNYRLQHPLHALSFSRRLRDVLQSRTWMSKCKLFAPVCKQYRYCHSSKVVGNNEFVDLTFDDVEKLVKSGSVKVIDVREPTELVQFGQYKDAINIPLGQLEEALKMPKDKFRQQFGVEKPDDKNENVVFCCMAGNRSFKAVQIASKLGFARAKHYKGGWDDYHKQMGLPYKQTSK